MWYVTLAIVESDDEAEAANVMVVGPITESPDAGSVNGNNWRYVCRKCSSPGNPGTPVGCAWTDVQETLMTSVL